MQIELLHQEVKRKRDKIDSQSRVDLTDAEIDAALNEAIIKWTRTRYNGNNAKREGFEVTQQRIDDLSTLVIKAPDRQPLLSPDYTNTGNGIYRFDLSNLAFPYMHYLRATALVYGCDVPYRVEIVQHDDLTYKLKDEFNKPSSKWRRVLGTFGRSDTSQERSLYIYTNGDFEVTGLYLDYLKQPNEVSLGTYNDIDGNATAKTECDLPDSVHDQIVDLAVKLLSDINEDIVMSQLTSAQLIQNE